MAFVVYVAGPFRAQTAEEMADNIHAAKSVARQVWACGAVALLPHTNHGWLWGQVDEMTALEGCLTLLSACDAVVLAEGWETSAGVCAEIEAANRRNIPVFEDINALTHWLMCGPSMRPH